MTVTDLDTTPLVPLTAAQLDVVSNADHPGSRAVRAAVVIDPATGQALVAALTLAQWMDRAPTPPAPAPEPTPAPSPAQTVTLSSTAYRVEHHTTGQGPVDTYLVGPRGARYYLRPYLGPDTGLRQVISLGSGAPLRRRGNEVRVHVLGDVIEAAPPRRR